METVHLPLLLMILTRIQKIELITSMMVIRMRVVVGQTGQQHLQLIQKFQQVLFSVKMVRLQSVLLIKPNFASLLIVVRMHHLSSYWNVILVQSLKCRPIILTIKLMTQLTHSTNQRTGRRFLIKLTKKYRLVMTST